MCLEVPITTVARTARTLRGHISAHSAHLARTRCADIVQGVWGKSAHACWRTHADWRVPTAALGSMKSAHSAKRFL